LLFKMALLMSSTSRKISFLILYTLFLVFNVIDYIGTVSIIKAGAIELNPIGAYLITKYGVVVGIFLLKIVSVLFGTFLFIVYIVYKSRENASDSSKRREARLAYASMRVATFVMGLMPIYQIWLYSQV